MHGAEVTMARMKNDGPRLPPIDNAVGPNMTFTTSKRAISSRGLADALSNMRAYPWTGPLFLYIL